MKNIFTTNELKNHISKSSISIDDFQIMISNLDNENKHRILTIACYKFASNTLHETKFNAAFNELAKAYYMEFLRGTGETDQLKKAYQHTKVLATNYIVNNLIPELIKLCDNYKFTETESQYNSCLKISNLIDKFSISKECINNFQLFIKYRTEICTHYISQGINLAFHNSYSKEHILAKKVKWEEVAKYGNIDINTVHTTISNKEIKIADIEESYV